MKTWRLLGHFLMFTTCALFTTSCGRSETEYQALLAENARLQMELDKTKAREVESSGHRRSSAADAPDLNLAILELWNMRFNDSSYRAKRVLADKTIRVTGNVGDISEDSISLLERDKGFQVTVYFNKTYATQIKEGLASLEPGVAVTVQGKFIFERTQLDEAVFVERKSGRTLSSEEISTAAAEARGDTLHPSRSAE